MSAFVVTDSKAAQECGEISSVSTPTQYLAARLSSSSGAEPVRGFVEIAAPCEFETAIDAMEDGQMMSLFFHQEP
ncbi:hypothetical protein [Rhodococcus erythropolis]|uniref:hypothetical protein n=1 Tax=Rhodococcus erythropolis TaxID=1833 RepID=UPI003809B227